MQYFFFQSQKKGFEECYSVIEENNIYKKLFPSFFKMCLTSFYISQMNEKGGQKIACVNSNLKNVPSFYYCKNLMKNKSSIFEENVFKELESMGIKHQRNYRVGIYELDVVIDSNLVLEINGDTHCLYSIDGERYQKSYQLQRKMKHLKIFGIERYGIIHFMDWEKIDYDKKKRQQFLLNIIKNSEKID